MIRVFTLLPFIILMAWPGATEEIYRWTDEKGKLHFTDNLSNVPEPQRERVIRHEWYDPIRIRHPNEIDEPTVIPYTGEGKAIAVQAILNDRINAIFLLDTGSTYSQITKEDATRLGIDLDSATIVRTWLADGRYVSMPKVILKSIRLGNSEVKDLEVLVGEARLIGLNFIHQFHMILDFARRQIVLERNPSWKTGPSNALNVEGEFLVRDLEMRISEARFDIQAKRKRMDILLHEISYLKKQKDAILSKVADLKVQDPGDPGYQGRMEGLMRDLMKVTMELEEREFTIQGLKSGIDRLENEIRRHLEMLKGLKR